MTLNLPHISWPSQTPIAVLVFLIAWLLLKTAAFREEDVMAYVGDYYGEDNFQEHYDDDPFEVMAQQLYWPPESELATKAERLTALANKMIGIVDSGKAEDLTAICAPNATWHGDGMWYPFGFGKTCDEIVKLLKKPLSRLRSAKVVPLAILPNPRSNDVFVVGQFVIGADAVTGVVRLVANDEGKVVHIYHVVQPTDSTAKAMLKKPDVAIKARKSLPGLNIEPYTGTAPEHHMISMWAKVNRLWIPLGGDPSLMEAFVAEVPADFRYVAAEQVFQGYTHTSRDAFVEAEQKGYMQKEREMMMISAAYSPTHHVAVLHGHYLELHYELRNMQLAPVMEVLVFDTDDRLKEVWAFRQPLDIAERAQYFK